MPASDPLRRADPSLERSLPLPRINIHRAAHRGGRTMKKLAMFSIVCVVGLGVSACERDERTARQELSTAAREDPGYATDDPAAVVSVPDTAGGGQTMTGNLAEMNNSGASGVVTVTPRNGQTLIQLSVTGVQPGTQLRPTIHRGGCDQVGQLVHELERIRVENTGLAAANLTIPQHVETITDGFHSVRIYAEGGFQTPPISCAELPTTAAETRM
jgi:hypothetical protein